MSGWTLRLADRADQDIEEALAWTLAHFGPLHVDEAACEVEILRVLHDSMDLARHLDS